MRSAWLALPLAGLMVPGLAACRGPRSPGAARPRASARPATSDQHRPATPTTSPPASPPARIDAAPGSGAGELPPAPSQLAGTTVGTARYPVPDGAVIVSPSGRDDAAGTAGAPLRSVSAAVSRAAPGGTVVLRHGAYHESVVIPAGKRLTIQPWPAEAVWFDGSVPVSGWTASGGRWQRSGWATEFDASPTFTRGARDHTAEGWGFIDPAHPMAADPDQVWIGGVPQRQVGSLDVLRPGAFFHDRGADRLYLGSDPAGREVRASTLQRAVMARAGGSVLRGFGVRRYAPSVPDMGAVTVEEPGIEVEHVAIDESATIGLFVAARDARLRNLRVERSGMLGVLADEADGLVAERMRIEGNNVEHFNESPSAGGMKVTTSRGATARDSVFGSNGGTGLWFDVSSYDMTVVGCEMRANAKHGISLEISAKALVANNIVAQNRGNGIKVNNTSDVSIWNNTLMGNDRSLYLVQDRRTPSADSPDRDRRRPYPDPTMNWRLGPVTVRNNILSGPASGDCLLCVEDQTKKRTAEQMGVTVDSDVFNRPDPSSPRWVAVWSRGAGTATFTSLAAFTAGTGQGASAQAVDGAALVDADGGVTGGAPIAGSAQPLPLVVADATGIPRGTTGHGALLS